MMNLFELYQPIMNLLMEDFKNTVEKRHTKRMRENLKCQKLIMEKWLEDYKRLFKRKNEKER